MYIDRKIWENLEQKERKSPFLRKLGLTTVAVLLTLADDVDPVKVRQGLPGIGTVVVCGNPWSCSVGRKTLEALSMLQDGIITTIRLIES